MAELRQFGRLKSASVSTLSAGRFADLLGDVRSAGTIEVGGSRDEASVVEIGEIDSKRDIIEIELDNGIRLWQSVETANEYFSGFRTAIEVTHRVTLPMLSPSTTYDYLSAKNAQQTIVPTALISAPFLVLTVFLTLTVPLMQDGELS